MNIEIWDLLQPLILVAGLIGLNAFLVAGDFALIQFNFGRFGAKTQEQSELPGLVDSLLKDVNQNSRVIRLGINLATVGLGFALVGPLRLLASIQPVAALAAAAIPLAFLLAVLIHFLLGELVPRSMALSHPGGALRLAAPFIHPLRFLLGPLVRILDRLSKLFFRAFGIDGDLETNLLDVEVQIHSLLRGGEELSPIMETILKNAIDLRKRVVQDILLPRNRIQYFDLTDSNNTNIEIARKTGHTRFPLCEGDLDRCIGLVHIKDIFRYPGDWGRVDLRTLKRDILRFSLDDPLDRVLQRLLTQKRHMALVQDEFGGTVGAVTLEDVLEELVGDIHDEFDREEELIKPMPEGDFLVDGLAPIHDVADVLGVEIEETEVSTFGGYITTSLGRMPLENTRFEAGRLEIRVTGVNEKRVTSARVRVRPPDEDTTSP